MQNKRDFPNYHLGKLELLCSSPILSLHLSETSYFICQLKWPKRILHLPFKCWIKSTSQYMLNFSLKINWAEGHLAITQMSFSLIYFEGRICHCTQDKFHWLNKIIYKFWVISLLDKQLLHKNGTAAKYRPKLVWLIYTRMDRMKRIAHGMCTNVCKTSKISFTQGKCPTS